MTTFEKIGCKLIGWDKNLLSQCGEASFRTLRKYTSAIIIIMIIWGVIGFALADRYLGVEAFWGKLLVALVLSLVILLIERVIILNMGGRLIYVFRSILAIAMAVLGSFIFDQIIFRNDLEEAVKKNAKQEWLSDNKKNIDEVSQRMNLLKLATDSLNDELVKHPVINTVTTTTTTTNTGQKDSLNHDIKVTTTNVVRSQIENPLKQQVDANNEQILSYQTQIKNLYNLQSMVDSIVNNNFKMHKIGFLEELKASVNVIFESWISIVFYAVLFIVLLCLELFVVTMKKGEKKCEYELLIEHRLKLQEMHLKKAADELMEKYITKTLEDA